MSDNALDTSTAATQSTINDAPHPNPPSTTSTVKKTADHNYNSIHSPGEVYYLYPHHYPQYTPTASGISMRGRKRPVGVSGRGGVSAATNNFMPPRTNTSGRGGGGTTKNVFLLNPVNLQNTPFNTHKEEPDHLVQQQSTTELENEEEDEEEEDDDEYKEEESDEEGEDEKEGEEEEVKDEASSSISNILVDHNDDEMDILEELRDLLEDYEDDCTLFANHMSGMETSMCKATESLEKKISDTHNKDTCASASSPLEAEENYGKTDIEHKETYRGPNDAYAASTLSTTSSLDTGERHPLKVVNNNINTAALSNNKHNYPSVSAPPSPTIHNSTFRCPLDFIRHPQPKNQPAHTNPSNQPQRNEEHTDTSASEPTQKQLELLTHLLDQFYQVLLQQAVITVRHLYLQKQQAVGQDPRVLLMDTATKHSQHPQRFTNEGSEHLSQDELAEILDGAVGMLQELDMLRKNALRNIVTFEEQQTAFDSSPCSSLIIDNNHQVHSTTTTTTSLRRVLTRSLFIQKLQERYDQQNRQQLHQNSSSSRIRGFPTVFDIRGLSKLEDTFKVMDESVVAYKNTLLLSSSTRPSETIVNILHPRQHGDACELLLQYSDAAIDTRLIPGKIEISRLFTDPQMLLENNQLVMSKIAENFTSSEDNLVVKGVNVFGEKAWSSISQRFLPNRPTRDISHRYTKLCILVYKACGISVNDIIGGSTRDVGGDIGHLIPVTAPAKYNVNRWSFEEDILLLKAVPVLGHSWAEIKSKWINHRTRGHLRKRYQVLVRRIKAGVKRDASDNKSIITEKQSKKSEVATASSYTLKIKYGEKVGPDSTIGKNSSKKTGNTEVLTTHSGMMPIAESKASYHPYPYYGTLPYYHPYFYPLPYPSGATNLCVGSATEKSTETTFSAVSKFHSVHDKAKNNFVVPADNRGNNKILLQQNQANIHAEKDVAISTFDSKGKKNISGALTVDHKMKKNEILRQDYEKKSSKDSCSDAVETTMKKSDSQNNQKIDRTDSKTIAGTLRSTSKKGRSPPVKKSELLFGALPLDPKMKKNEAHTQINQISKNKKTHIASEMMNSTVKKSSILPQHSKEIISTRTEMLDTINEKGRINSKHNGCPQILSEPGIIGNSLTKFPGDRSLNIYDMEKMLLCHENKECTKVPPAVRFRISSEDDRSLLCYENEEALVKPLHKKLESSDVPSTAIKKEDSPSASKSPDGTCILLSIENETPSQLIDIPTQLLDLLDGGEASHIGIEKIIEENESKCHSSVCFTRLVGSKKSGILNSGRDLTHTSTNFDDVRNALMQGAEEVSQLPQFTLEASGLSFLGPFEYNSKSTYHDGNICSTKGIYAKVLERATNKLPSDPQKDHILTLNENEVKRGSPLSQSLMSPQKYNDKEINQNNYPQFSDTTLAHLTNNPPISLPPAFLEDIEFNDFACGEKTRDALELNSNSAILQGTSIDFVCPEALDQYPVLSFERFDPVSALKSLGHPISPARSSNMLSSATLKRPQQSLFASAVSTVQEKDGKKMKASKEEET